MKTGDKIKVIDIKKTIGLFVGKDLLANRYLNAEGTVLCHVPGHGGDLWCVEQTDGSQAVYMTWEMEIV